MLEYFGTQAIWVDSLVEVEPVLRNVLYGVPKDGQAPAWVTGSIRWRHKEKGLAVDVLYSEGWQAAAAAALRSLVDQLDFCFAAKSEEGLDATLHRKRPSGRQYRKLDGKQEAQLVAVACSPAPAGRARWTMTLLADRLVELNVVKSIDPATVWRTLKKTRSSRGSSGSGSSRPSRTRHS